MINEAIAFLLSNVIDPALNSSELDKKFKDKIKNAKNLVKNFKKVGDLYKYLNRFRNGHGAGNDSLYYELKRLNLVTFEDIISTFENKFKYEIEDKTVLDDFIIGENYSSYDISILAETYNVQSGIYLIGDDKNLQAIFIKVTLENGNYPNKWLIKNDELKYYMYSRDNNFSVDYKYNKAIIDSNGVPIYVFIKEDTICTLTGVFNYISHEIEEDNKMWFKLKKIDSINSGKIITNEEFINELEKKINGSKNLSREERKLRLKDASKKPEKISTINSNFKRNPDVIAEVLDRANGICESCGKDAPFIRAADSTPYLEVHHIKPLSQDGDDTVENAVALCPNCHRKMHFGIQN